MQHQRFWVSKHFHQWKKHLYFPKIDTYGAVRKPHLPSENKINPVNFVLERKFYCLPFFRGHVERLH